MAGHSKFKNIQYRKAAQDKKRAQLFARLAREIMVAAKAGLPDPQANARLRTAVMTARAQNMPKDRIQRAMQKASTDGAAYRAARYEGFAAGGVGVIVEALTDNRNRTAAELRAIFTRHDGQLGESGAVSFMFAHKGVVRYAAEAGSEEEVWDAALHAGAQDVASSPESYDIICDAETLHGVAEKLQPRLGDPQAAALEWRPKTDIAVRSEEVATKLLHLLDGLEECEDVQNIYANFEMEDALLQRVSTDVADKSS